MPYEGSFQVNIRGYGWGLRFSCVAEEISFTNVRGYTEIDHSPHSPEALLAEGDEVFLQFSIDGKESATIEAEVTQKTLLSELCQIDFRFEKADQSFFPLLQNICQQNLAGANS